ncbi:MAG: PqqD family protein [Clostridia bacterium]|nr:PqqD family protein [Clostridia bacterium]
MKLKQEFIAYDTEGLSMLVPTGSAGFAGLVQGNRTLGVILSLLQAETTEAEVVAAMLARFDAPEDVIAKDVRRVIDALRGVGALDE